MASSCKRVFFDKVKNLRVRIFYWTKISDWRDAAQNVLLMALITHYILRIIKKGHLHALRMAFEYFHVEADVSTTKNNTTGCFDIIKTVMTSYRQPAWHTTFSSSPKVDIHVLFIPWKFQAERPYIYFFFRGWAAP